MKRFLISLIMLSSCVFALDLNQLKEPRPLEGRMSNTDKVESRKTKLNQVEEQKVQTQAQENNTLIQEETTYNPDLTYADLNLKRLANDIAYEIEEDSMKINSDLAILWQATTARSETMKYTIYKLSNPDEDKPNESTLKKILRPIANFSSIAGASVAGNPFVATSDLVGGGLVNSFMKDDKELNYRFSKVSDADMVLLVRKIDTLQKKLLSLYMDYKTKQNIVNMLDENLKKREEIYKLAQNKIKEELTIADVYYRNAKTNLEKAIDEYSTSRAILENLVGLEAIQKIEE